MKITVNGKALTLEHALNVLELLSHQQVKSPDLVAVERNGEILDREAFGDTIVDDGDQMEFLFFMGGGKA